MKYILFFLFPFMLSAQLKAWPDDAVGGPAYGGGSEVSGGRGGVLVIVNTLNANTALTYNATYDIYTGGLEAALESAIGPRYIIFSVSGVIDDNISIPVSALNASIYVSNSGDITLWGQSAPQGGITLYRGFIIMEKCSNVIIQHLAVRPDLVTGDPTTDDTRSTGLKVGNKNVMIDHVSSSWGGDKAIIAGDWQSGFPMQNITVQNSLMADSNTLGFSVDGNNGGAGDWDAADKISWYRNFFVGGHRTPNLGGFDGYGEIMNNLVWNMNPYCTTCRLTNVPYGSPQINHIGNYYYVVENDATVKNRVQFVGTPNTDPLIYAKRNYLSYNNGGTVVLTGSGAEDNEVIWSNFSGGTTLSSVYFTETEHTTGILNRPTELTPSQVVDTVTANAGVRYYMSDAGVLTEFQTAYDADVVTNWNAKNNIYRRFESDRVAPVITSNTRPGTYDTDFDGMADVWETTHFGDLSQGYNGDFDNDGYRNIEEFYYGTNPAPLVVPDFTNTRTSRPRIGSSPGAYYLGTERIN